MASCFLSLTRSVWEIGVTKVILGGCCGCGRVGVGMRMSGAPCGRIVMLILEDTCIKLTAYILP